MKVLLCHNYYQQAGGEDQVYEDEAWMLRHYGHEVKCFDIHNDSIEGMGRTELVRKTFWNTEVANQIRELIGDFRPDVMHSTNSFPLLSPAIYHVAAEMGVAVVQSLHNYRLLCPSATLMREGTICEKCIGKSFAWPSIVHACYRSKRSATAVLASMLTYHRMMKTWSSVIDGYISPSEITRSKYVKAGFAPESIKVKANFLTPDPGPGQGDGNYAIFVGRLSPEKGIDTLLKAWALMSADVPLRVVGDGPLASQVQEAAANDSRITWLGRRPLQEVCELVGRAACLVMPSIWFEPFGRTVIEAFAVGTPVIASRMGAMEELIDHGRTGIFFRPADPKDLSETVSQFLREGDAIVKMREAVRQEYLLKYTAEANYGQLISIYDTAIQTRAAKSLARTK